MTFLFPITVFPFCNIYCTMNIRLEFKHTEYEVDGDRRLNCQAVV